MEYVCQNSQCPKYEILYPLADHPYNQVSEMKAEFVDCTLCNLPCDTYPDPAPDPAPEIALTHDATLDRILDQLSSSPYMVKVTGEIMDYVRGFIAEEDVSLGEVFFPTMDRIVRRICIDAIT